MSNKLIGQGTVTSFSNDGFSADTNVVPCIQTITLPDSEVADIEAACIEDTAIEKFGSRQRDRGQFSFEYAYDPADTVHANLEARHITGETQTWRLVLQPTASGGTAQQLEFTGYIQAIAGSSFGASDLVLKTATVTLQSDITISTPP